MLLLFQILLAAHEIWEKVDYRYFVHGVQIFNPLNCYMNLLLTKWVGHHLFNLLLLVWGLPYNYTCCKIYHLCFFNRSFIYFWMHFVPFWWWHGSCPYWACCSITRFLIIKILSQKLRNIVYNFVIIINRFCTASYVPLQLLFKRCNQTRLLRCCCFFTSNKTVRLFWRNSIHYYYKIQK
mgnify:CR=1 FL=1